MTAMLMRLTVPVEIKWPTFTKLKTTNPSIKKRQIKRSAPKGMVIIYARIVAKCSAASNVQSNSCQIQTFGSERYMSMPTTNKSVEVMSDTIQNWHQASITTSCKKKK